MAISTNLLNKDVLLGNTAKPISGNLITGESYEGPSGTALELLPTNTSTNETDPGDTRTLWEKMQDGWNDFLNELEYRFGSYYAQANVGNDALSSIMAHGDPSVYSEPNNLISPGGSQIEESPDVGGDTTNTSNIDNVIDEALSGGPSVSDYMRNHPNASMEDVFKWMASQSDEWAEKYMDYVLENQSIDKQNQYTASREDTAYQRLVADLKAAGLNPAMMYGSSASPSASGSSGIVRASEGANSRTLSNYDKLKRLLLAYMTFSTNTVAGSLRNGVGMLSLLASLI